MKSKVKRSKFNLSEDIEIACPDCGGLNVDPSKLESDKFVCHKCNITFRKF